MNASEAKAIDAQSIYEYCLQLKEEGAEMSFAEVQSVDEVKAWIESPREHIFILREANHIIALIKASQGARGREHSVFMSAAVRKSRRGEGLVRTLSAYVYPILRERGVLILRAYIYSNNHSSINAVLKEGFSCTGAVHMHHRHSETGQWIDDMIFHKHL